MPQNVVCIHVLSVFVLRWNS